VKAFIVAKQNIGFCIWLFSSGYDVYFYLNGAKHAGKIIWYKVSFFTFSVFATNCCAVLHINFYLVILYSELLSSPPLGITLLPPELALVDDP
jgi:hypothetical protein